MVMSVGWIPRNGQSTGADLEASTDITDIRNIRLGVFPNEKESSFGPIDLDCLSKIHISGLQGLQLKEVVRS